MITLPYSELDMRLALLSFDEKLLTEDLLDTINNMAPSNAAELLDNIAQHFGLTKETLINSPNYSTLKENYTDDKFHEAVKLLEGAGISTKQAYALLAAATGILDHG